MEVVVQILMLIVLLSTLLKMSFVRWGYVVGYALCLALFLVLSYEASSLQTKTGIAQYLTVRELIEYNGYLRNDRVCAILSFCLRSSGARAGRASGARLQPCGTSVAAS